MSQDAFSTGMALVSRAYREKVDELTQDNNQLKFHIRELSDDLNVANDKIAELENKLKDTLAELKSVSAMKNGISSRYSTLRKKIADLSSESDNSSFSPNRTEIFTPGHDDTFSNLLSNDTGYKQSSYGNQTSYRAQTQPLKDNQPKLQPVEPSFTQTQPIRTPTKDLKEKTEYIDPQAFYKQVKQSLLPEDYNKFAEIVQAFNNQKKDVATTIREVKELFGVLRPFLCNQFEALIHQIMNVK
eukprot:TRINITY_DN120_c0_g1_i1.p1 TRINITY_DN120_c0_g1~~TRINITY_DN120_c0_g1_i1.p1  ORF type:complete len:243 (-),score=80.45 TRINITY_DN120_c0_g1_i1:33-761(-)